MLSASDIGTIIYASMLVILCVGFSLTHLLEKFPNFAHVSLAYIGTIFASTFVRLWGFDPYLALAVYASTKERRPSPPRAVAIG